MLGRIDRYLCRCQAGPELCCDVCKHVSAFLQIAPADGLQTLFRPRASNWLPRPQGSPHLQQEVSRSPTGKLKGGCWWKPECTSRKK